MGLCSDTSWRRLQERRGMRAAADAAVRVKRAQLAERLSGLSATYAERGGDQPSTLNDVPSDGGTA
jgi:hypothetical protein